MDRTMMQFLISYIAVIVPPTVFLCVKLYQAFR